MKNIASVIDHTMLKPNATKADILKLCQEANSKGFATVCVPPTYVDLASKKTDEKVGVCTVIGFPFGYDDTISKIAAIHKAVESGATELDVVVNISKIKSGDWDYIKNEIDQLVTITKHKHSKVLKLIFETAYLDEKEITTLCEYCNEFLVDFAKTSTGYAPTGAELHTVKLMRSLLNSKVKVKASGGIADLASANAFIAAGADRIGTSKGLQIVGK